MLPPPPRAPWIEPSSHRGGGRSERPRFNKNSVHSVRQRSRAESGRTDFQSDWLGDFAECRLQTHKPKKAAVYSSKVGESRRAALRHMATFQLAFTHAESRHSFLLRKKHLDAGYGR